MFGKMFSEFSVLGRCVQETEVETDLSSTRVHIRCSLRTMQWQKFFLLMAYGTKESYGFHYLLFSLNFLEKTKYMDLLIVFIFLR